MTIFATYVEPQTVQGADKGMSVDKKSPVTASAASPKPLSLFLQSWIVKLRNVSSPVWWERLEGYLEGSWVMFFSIGAIAALGVVRLMEVWLTVSFADATRQMCLLNGMASGFVGQWVFIRKRKPITDGFLRLLQVSEELEAAADEQMKEYFARVAKRARFWYLFETSYTTVSMVGMLVPPMVMGELQLELWGLAPRSPLQFWGLIFLQIFVCPFAYGAYKFFSLVLNANMCCAALYRVLGARVRLARGRRAFAELARVHSRLDGASAALDAEFNGCTSVFLMPVLVAAGLSTYNLLSGRMDLYCLTPGQLILLFLVPICQTGQALEDASGTGLLLAAYSGAWLVEGRSARRLCLGLMTRAAAPRHLSARGIGNLNHPTGQACLKVWFRFTQLLFNLAR